MRNVKNLQGSSEHYSEVSAVQKWLLQYNYLVKFFSSVLYPSTTSTYAPLSFMKIYTSLFSRSRIPTMRRIGISVIAIAVLICFSVFSLVSVGEGFRIVISQKDGLAIRKRDGSAITFDMPWRQVHHLDTKNEG